MALHWEKSGSDPQRCKVPGGWLIKDSLGEGGQMMFFAADGLHEWDGQWEKLEPARFLAGGGTARARVPGGWLVRQLHKSTIAFYPDPQHEWDGNSLE